MSPHSAKLTEVTVRLFLLSPSEEKIAKWKGSKTPDAQISSILWFLTQGFGLRGRQERHEMRMDWRLSFMQRWRRRAAYRRSNKVQQWRWQSCTERRNFQPQMFAVGGERCPFGLFKQFHCLFKWFNLPLITYAMVGVHSTEPKIEWQHLVQKSNDGLKYHDWATRWKRVLVLKKTRKS